MPLLMRDNSLSFHATANEAAEKEMKKKRERERNQKPGILKNVMIIQMNFDNI